MTAGCGGWYVLPRELSLSTGGTLLQHPAVELQQLRTGAAITSTSHLAAGGQVEVLVRCTLPTVLPTEGILAIKTLQTMNGSQSVTVGYDFTHRNGSGVVGFASVPAVLGQWGNTSRTDRTVTLQSVRGGGTVELHVFVDNQVIETFFAGETTITTATSNAISTDALSSSFVNTANLSCSVTSWGLSL
jgi:sucrose-6-phosphate hydrolase SacC (GH32 family)